MPEQTKLTAKHERLVREVASSIGLCLLLYQDIEIALKALLPHMVFPKHKNRPMEAGTAAVDLFASKVTLGPLFKAFKQHLEVEKAKNFTAYLSAVADHRNELVHGFRLRAEGWLKTEDECRAALALLDERHRFARYLQKIVNGQLKALTDTWDQVYPDDDQIDQTPSTSPRQQKPPGSSSHH